MGHFVKGPMTQIALPARFDVVRHLGAGGFGEVYEVADRTKPGRFALKTFTATSAEAVANIKAEFRALGELRHPNLVGLGELFQHGERLSFTMELVDGVDILTWFRSSLIAAGSGAHPTLETAHAALRKVMRGLAEAISALHRAGKLHRDIKPANVLVTAEHRAVLIDYGLTVSRGLERGTQLAGTIPYLAPECVAGEESTEAADWYAFGALLFHLLVHEVPYPGTAQVSQHLKLAGPPSSHRLAAAPRDLAELAIELLQPAPPRRLVGDEVLRRLGGSTSGPIPRVTELARTDAPTVRYLVDYLDELVESTECVLLDGGPASGKTPILDGVCAAAEARGILVLRTSTHPREAVAFEGLASLVEVVADHLRSLPIAEQLAMVPVQARDLATMFPTFERVAGVVHLPQSTSPDHLAPSAGAALADVLRALAARGPVLIAIDNAQWWSIDALVVMAHVVAGLPERNLLVVVAKRPTEGRAAAFARLCTDAPITTTVVTLATTVETRERKDSRVDHLSPLARRLLDVIASSVVVLPADLAGAIAHVNRGELAHSTQELVAAGLASSTPAGLALDEDGCVALERMVPTMLADWRHRIAQALQSANADAGILARAFHAAGDLEAAVPYARLAARSAHERGAPALACELYRLVQACGVDDVATRLAWVAAARDAGLGRDAAAELLGLADLDPSRAIEHRRQAGLIFLQIGEVERGLALLADTDQLSLPAGPRMTVVSLGLARLGQLGRLRLRRRRVVSARRLEQVDVLWTVAGALGLTDSMRGALVQTRCVKLAMSSGDPARGARAIASEAAFRAADLPRRSKIDAMLERARALAESANDDHARAWVRACRGFSALLYGEWSTVLDEMGVADEQLGRIPGTHWERTSISHAQICAQFFTGDLGALAASGWRLLAESRRRGDRFGEVIAHVATVTPLLMRGEYRAAARVAEAANDAWSHPHHVQRSFLALQRANVRLITGDGAGALAVVDETIAAMGVLMRVPLVRIPLHEVGARAALIAAADAPPAGRAALVRRAHALCAALRREPLAWARALARLHDGGLAQLAGDHEAAHALRVDAADACERAGMPMHAAFARTRAGIDPQWIPASLVVRWADLVMLHAP